MLWSKAFIPTLKETPQEAESISHQLMLRAGLMRMLMSGAYSYLPAGLKALNNVEKIVRQEMNACGASELLLPALQPQELWVNSGRDKLIGEVMIKFTDRRGRKICLGPTHEEVITELVKNNISSYRQLPLVLYQVQTKFRDEIRPRFGVVRACEFVMKDAYSFDRDEPGLDINYQAMYQAYNKIFTRCGLDFLAVEADSGIMGGSASHEFMVPAASGEDVVFKCPQCNIAKPFSEGKEENCDKCAIKMDKLNCIEVGHIFKLGTKYSSILGANFLNEEGRLKPVVMGCYGIGVSRLLAAIIEQNYDSEGIIWPKEVAPYQVIILPLDMTDNKITDISWQIYADLKKKNIEVLIDDRNERAGVKFKDADLLGINLQLVVGKDTLKNDTVELRVRGKNKKTIDSKEAVLSQIEDYLNV